MNRTEPIVVLLLLLFWLLFSGGGGCQKVPEIIFSAKYLDTKGRPKLKIGIRKSIEVRRLIHKCEYLLWNKLSQKRFQNFRKPNFGQIFGHRRAKTNSRNTKMNRCHETHPIRVNARYGINWVKSYSKRFRNFVCRWTGGRATDRQQGESSIPPFHIRRSGGI